MLQSNRYKAEVQIIIAKYKGNSTGFIRLLDQSFCETKRRCLQRAARKAKLCQVTGIQGQSQVFQNIFHEILWFYFWVRWAKNLR
jgi:hypothetical protein